MTYQNIVDQIQLKKSFLCVGLDTDIKKMPEHLKDAPNAIFEFNKAIVDATAAYTVSYKPNIAFYESMGVKGWQQLEMTVEYIKANYPEIFLIADAKRGDIGNTSKMYAEAFFKNMNFDAVTVAPYMGADSVKPFLEYEGKFVILLALTSNPSAADFQYFRNSAQKPLFSEVIDISKSWGSEQNLMYVVGATKASMLVNIREQVPNHFLLIPGVGAQGGSLDEVVQYGMADNCGLLVNSSRAIIYASQGEDFAEVAEIKANEMQMEMAQYL